MGGPEDGDGEDESRPSEYRQAINSVMSNFGDRPQEENRFPGAAEVEEMPLEKKAAVIKCVEESMDMMGRTGKEVFLELVYRRYGVVIDDVVDDPRKFMRALKFLEGSTAAILERHALDELEQKLKVSASSLEEAVAMLGGRSSVRRSEKKAVKKEVVEEEEAEPRPPERFEYRFSASEEH